MLRVFVPIFVFLLSFGVEAKFDATIPVVDLNDYYSKDRHDHFIHELAQAMQSVGFVAVVNSTVDRQILDNAYCAAQNFYAKPLEYKMRVNDPQLNGQRGYICSEIAKGQVLKDFKEYYHISRDYPDHINSKYGYKTNLWPDQEFKISMQKFIVEMDAYVRIISQALAESIGESEDFFTTMTDEGDFLVRAIHYPANPPANTVWAAAHTDIDLFTILPRATAEGLQVLNAHGEWVDVVVPDDAFIINAGDMLQNITNGVYKSAMHRVICKNSAIERYSIVAFVHPRPNDQLGPRQRFIEQVGRQKFANVTRNELLFERLIDLGLHSADLLQEFARSGAIERLIDVKRASPTAMRALAQASLASPKVIAALQQLDE